jgi:hypothetical protein
MMIADVIRNATTEHEIYFLLTAYLEAVRFCDKLNDVPEHMASLPLAGIDDVRIRFNNLVAELDAASKRLDHKACETIREALHIFGAARHRLGSLNADRRLPLGERRRADVLKETSGASGRADDNHSPL